MNKIIIGLFALFSFCILPGCNDSGGGQSQEQKEDAVFEAYRAEAIAFALSPENIAANRINNSGGGSGGGGGGSFLWKPNSDSNGRLVVLLPSSYVSVATITISGSFGTETATRGSVGNGGRPHYRFSKPGSAYGTNIKVSGGGHTWLVSNGALRNEA